MKLDIQSRHHRVAKNFRIRQEAVDMLDKISEKYNANQGTVIEALLLQYGPKILKEK